MLSYQTNRCSKQGHKKIHLAHAKGRRHILKTEWGVVGGCICCIACDFDGSG